MEYVNGGSLHTYLKTKANRQMDEPEAKYLFKQVVSAIHYCHSRCITHRDIKLENILLNEKKNQVKLIDFGFSTCIPNDKKVKLFCGTPSYMAPEIVSKKEYTGPPADVWGLGVLYYALLCGKFPFKGQNDKELYKKICKNDLEFPDSVSSNARTFITRVLTKEPEHRPSAKDILQDPYMS
jgi:serine/threonine protein kinase